ncbi:MAG: DUF3565 domain-containing protein [Chloroflexi bacterium]|nr:DUF3565 domain-containing protein [Chloroflexota bacterium]
MKQKIVSFSQDEIGDWQAVLACGHRQHVRHNPPLVNRLWVQTEAGRSRFLGYELNCKLCDGEGVVDNIPDSRHEPDDEGDERG